MTGWILGALALWVVQTFLPPVARFVSDPTRRSQNLRAALGNRDAPPPLPQWGERADRARANLQEALPVFLTVALLLELYGPSGLGTAVPGAALFLVARVLYVPAYLSGVFGLRSAIWVASWIGLAGMIADLVGSGLPG